MQIRMRHYPGATLPEDRKEPLTLNGENELVLSRNEYCFSSSSADAIKDLKLANFWFVLMPQRTRIGRMLAALPHLWRFCK